MPCVVPVKFKVKLYRVTDLGRHSGEWGAVIPPGLDLCNFSDVFTWKLESLV